MSEEKGIRKRIRESALKILRDSPEGLRFSELKWKIKEALPNANPHTIEGSIYNLQQLYTEITKPSRGLFKYDPSRQTAQGNPKSDVESSLGREQDESAFYEPFRKYLIEDLEDAKRAITLGGSSFGEKWSTPDVLGAYTSNHKDIIKRLEPEITSAEIKITTNPQELITGFGQACAYLLFSHKSYLVIPRQSGVDVADRIDSLCLLFGIGLILFNRENDENPMFEIRSRATKHHPDIFYVNYYLNRLREEQLHSLGL